MAAAGKCILVTGPPAVGKTTLIIKVLETLKTSHPNFKVQGFYTREIRQGSERVGFEVVTLDGRRGPLASTTNSSPESFKWPTVGRYKVDVSSFELVALPELQVKEDTDLFIIDEIGKMELYSSSFFPAVLDILESNIPLLASIPIPKGGRDIPGVARLRNHPGATIFTLNTGNRDAIKEQIYSQLKFNKFSAHFVSISFGIYNFWSFSHVLYAGVEIRTGVNIMYWDCPLTDIHPESFKWPTVGRYKVDVSSFELVALPELLVKEDTDLFIIDEIGKMELYSSSFFPAVLNILESNIPLLASIPIPKGGRDIPGVARLRNHPGATIFTLNTGNMDAVKERIYSQLVNLLQNH
ncbi:hypothetical protein TEA_015495 [Camellia sinensis var. sinensis]|uniref:AAA+ ATPase domain-containing protein n=1 Tax=Camellia sinensis var. sinensis TaxID=542762 RepID=A0A4S4DNI6_CAMSN|nr:hypothetical protein TEA_015495 [Camellia sinensis var. sinensis]